MTITDKLPKAPEGYAWKSSINVTENDTRVFLRLERDYSSPVPFLGTNGFYEFVSPTESSVIEAAHKIIGVYSDKLRLDDYLTLKTAEASKVYADLLTGD